MLSTHNLLCRKIATSCPAYSFNARCRWQTNTLPHGAFARLLLVFSDHQVLVERRHLLSPIVEDIVGGFHYTLLLMLLLSLAGCATASTLNHHNSNVHTHTHTHTHTLHLCYILNHRLNGSSSPVLTATSLSYGKAKNSTPTESKPLIWLK